MVVLNVSAQRNSWLENDNLIDEWDQARDDPKWPEQRKVPRIQNEPYRKQTTEEVEHNLYEGLFCGLKMDRGSNEHQNPLQNTSANPSRENADYCFVSLKVLVRGSRVSYTDFPVNKPFLSVKHDHQQQDLDEN